MHTRASRIALGTVAGLTALTLLFGTAVSAATSENSNTNSSLRRDGVCMQGAVEKRDTAIVAAINTFSAAWISAITTRTTALKDAWAKNDVAERRTGVKTAWKNFRATHKANIKAFHTARKAAWKTFIEDQKTCKVPKSIDKTTEKVDTLEPKF